MHSLLQLRLNGHLGSAISSSLERSHDPILKGETVNFLQFTIVEQLNLLFEQHNIILPPTWTTYKILKHVIANDKALFRDIDFLVDLSADLALSGNSCWFETATNFLALCG